MNRMWTIMRKEFIHIIRDPRTLSLVLVMPVFMLLLLGYAVAVDIEDIPLAVYDLSHTAQSRRFADRFELTGSFEVVREADSSDELLLLIDRGDVRAGLVIPPDFGAQLSGSGSSNVQLFIDGSNPTVAQTAVLAAEMVSQLSAQEILVRRIERTMPVGGFHMPVDLRLRLLYNPAMKRINFMIPGLLGAILQIQALLLTAFAIVREREQGTLEQLIVTPVKSWELMLGKILPFVLVAFLNVGLTLAFSVFWFQVPVAGSVPLLFGLGLVFLLGSLGLGILISTVSRTQLQALHLISFILLPAFILSGFLIPRQNMPWIAYYSGFLLPLTYFLSILRGIVLKGIGLSYLWQHVAPMAAFSLAVFVASVLAFRKRLE